MKTSRFTLTLNGLLKKNAGIGATACQAKQAGFRVPVKNKLVFVLMGLVSLLAFSCTRPAEKQADQLPSDSLKTAVANSLAEFSASMLPHPLDTTQAFSLLQSYLDSHAEVYGSALALAPVISGTDTFRYAPYVYRARDAYITKYLEKSYDYTLDQWYDAPARLRKPCWSDPYLDTGGGDVKMITYSIPLFAADSSLVGVITADLELSALP